MVQPRSRTRPLLKRSARSARLLLGLTLAAAGCSGSTQDQPVSSNNNVGDSPLILVTTDIWADVVTNVACLNSTTAMPDLAVRVQTMVPPGSDAHQFEPSLRDRTAMSDADLLIANGLGLEGGLLGAIESAHASGTPMLFLGDHLDLDTHEPDEHKPDEHGHGVDPHIWFDPLLVAQAADVIATHLVSEVGLPEAAIRDCVEDYKLQLREIDMTVTQRFSRVPAQDRMLVTNHDSLGYLADHYDLTIVGTVLPSSSSLSATNPAALRALGQTIAETNTPAIFREALHNSAEAEALATEHGVKLVVLDTGSLGEHESYVVWFDATTAAIANGLQR